MARVVIIGQSPAVLAAAKACRTLDPQGSVVLISCDGQLPYDRSRLPAVLQPSGRSARKQASENSGQYRLFASLQVSGEVYIENAEVFAAAGIETILDREISRLSFNRRRVHLAGKTTLDYDVLVMADTPGIRWPEIKGVRKTGVFNLARLESVRGLLRYLPFFETAVVVPAGVEGLRAALILRQLGREVIVLEKCACLLPEMLSADQSAQVAALLEGRGIRLVTNALLTDVLGDAEMKAVRLSTGKVLACEAAVIEDVEPDLRFMDTGELLMQRRIPVTSHFATSVEGVYAIDSLAVLEQPPVAGGYTLPRAWGEYSALAAVHAAFGQAFDGVPPPVFQPFDPHMLFSPAEIQALTGVMP